MNNKLLRLLEMPLKNINSLLKVRSQDQAGNNIEWYA